MKNNVAHFALSWMILGLLSAPAYSADALVVQLRGTAIAQQRTVPDIDGDDNEDPALCFDVDLVDPRRGSVVGSATDCLSNVEFLGGPDTPIEEQEVKLINTTFSTSQKVHWFSVGWSPSNQYSCRPVERLTLPVPPPSWERKTSFRAMASSLVSPARRDCQAL